MSPLVLLAALPIDPLSLVRVDVPDHPDRISGTDHSSVLAAPPTDGTPWRWEAVPEPDGWRAPEAPEATNADLWHADGLTGAGVKVAIFDVGWFAPEADLDDIGEVFTHDCWIHPSCADPIDVNRPRLGHEVGVHGLGCAETVRDVAPGVELHLVRTSSLAGFENAVRWAIREDIDLISMSMSYFNESFYDGGPSVFHDLLVELEANDTLLVVSGGNHAQKHWSGAWRDLDQDGRLDFEGENFLYVDLPSEPLIYLNWNQHGRCGDTDLDARLLDDDGTIYAVSRASQDAEAEQCQPIERLRASRLPSGRYRMEVTHRRGHVADLRVDVNTREGSVVENIPYSSLGDPGSHPLAFAVAAVYVDGYLENPPEPFSSWGPNHAGHPKPDIAGPDGLTVDAYGPVGFFGTSASAPAVTGLIALILEDDPSLTPRQASQRLQGWAWGDGLAGHDPRFGAGKARLPVRDPVDLGCGRRPLVALLLLPPLGLFRRRRPRRPGVVCPSTPQGDL